VLYKNPGPYLYDGYRGFVSIILTVGLLFYVFFKRKKHYPKFLKLFTFTGIFLYILSLGPAFQLWGKVIKLPFIIPLPYALFYYLAPGFKGFRNSGRIEIFEIFVFSIAIGLFLSSKLKLRNAAIKIFSVIIICGFILFEATVPVPFSKVPSKNEIPKVYSFIATTPTDSVIAEFPLYNWRMLPYSLDEVRREYYSTIHFRKMLNGASGFSPDSWQTLVTSIASEFPKKNAFLLLKKTGINYIIVHADEFDKLNEKEHRFTKNSIVPNSLTILHILENNPNVN